MADRSTRSSAGVTPPVRARWLRVHWRLVLILVALASAGVFALWPRVVGREVEVFEVTRTELVQTVVTTGRVRAPAKISLAPVVAGRIVALDVDIGDEVRAGQVLVRLDDAEARAAVDEARARVIEVEARTKELQTTRSPAATEGVRQARVRLDDARDAFTRTESLAHRGVVSAEELARARTAVSLAESRLREAQIQAGEVGKGGSARLSVDAARQQAAAGLALAEARLTNTRIGAPTDGVIIDRMVELGDVLQPGTAVLLLAERGGAQLSIEPDERNLSLLAVGQRAMASAEAFSDQTFAARVSFIAPSVDRRRGTVEVRLDVPEPPAYLKPDMTVSVDIEVARKDSALSLPTAAVRGLASNQTWVLRVVGGRAQRADVRVGIRGDGVVEVLSGLEPGDQVISTSAMDVDAGTRVRARPRGH